MEGARGIKDGKRAGWGIVRVLGCWLIAPFWRERGQRVRVFFHGQRAASGGLFARSANARFWRVQPVCLTAGPGRRVFNNNLSPALCSLLPLTSQTGPAKL
jgi:hypothetical protein